ncbi:MAG: bifunctional enoyl-CoA hydratase/phosphate acetyltransferase [Rhodospirillales bacterium]|nr:bifunctional enoyl-CoA hydratase/phosphate acetyltransferase [Rhodospirillales bacterium]MCB9995524.1 bifunctional enoyl-CoA hydratase/phosphate acetyltransferase [Rhodospirillales bacterium]
MAKLKDRIKGMAPLKTAVICPTDENSLRGAFEAASAGIIEPILVGPEAEIRDAAQKAGIDITKFEIVAAMDDKAAAQAGIDLVKTGRAEALMKGLISTGTFLRPIVSKEAGLRTGRRMSHVFIMDDPDYHKPLYVTDAAVNNVQSLQTKKDITQNAIDLFRLLEGREPKVALLSATEKAVPDIPSSMEAKELKEMAARGEITGGIVDGPLAFDNAISAEAARLKNIHSKVAGDADILVFPSLEAGNIFYKSRSFMSNAERGGIVLGAKIPVILTSRAADSETRLSSAALALLYARKGAQPS